ncbi:hypothetical protein GYA19_02910 [Candidatus Beckwithbacteria bacterium]|nr:hypothetical protein [Candidatus Beckwithbacteria bacterium]
MTKNICLITTFHDPIGDKSIIFLKKQIKTIQRIFDEIVIGLTDQTNDIFFQFFKENQIKFIKAKSGFGSKTKRIILKESLKSSSDLFFSIDLDRLLFWLEHFPQELEDVLTKIKEDEQNQFWPLGRTRKAFLTHPKHQQKPETRTNEVLSKEIGKTLDVTTGCCVFTRKIAQLINQYAQGENSGVSDIEWPMIARLFGGARIKPIRVNGLAYETEYIFGENRSSNPKGAYGYSRGKLADDSIVMIEKVKKYWLSKK